jgi:PPOX class probable F420-dependent enzyme
VTAAEARRRFAGARVARLATIGADGRPHLVPVVFAVEDEMVWTAVDAKRKRTTRLQRIVNARRDARVALLADHYDDADWSALWWVRADGSARVLAADEPGGGHARELLAARYPQYAGAPPAGPVLAVAVERWSGWHA